VFRAYVLPKEIRFDGLAREESFSRITFNASDPLDDLRVTSNTPGVKTQLRTA